MRGSQCFMFVICLIFLFSSPVAAESQYGNIEYYYNGHLITASDSPETPKPLLKIGEPFKLRFEITCYKRNFLSVKLTSIGDTDFDIIEGPTSDLGDYIDETVEANETRIFEWTVAPNEEWAGGSAPINFYYQMTDLDTAKTITNGKFTAAYVTISEEYYDGPVTPDESIEEPSDDGSSPTTPAFTALCAVFALVVATVYRRTQN
ncbi:sarcinarray family MAST domain-containing protein [Methanolobus profundi]|uniref:Sarcinarray family protein n=1 Tax=Methanolobus profundi TaxID=487685 RepID=A0A1I4NNP6_9EURY|nr:sarcinarray family MAST domain-containing protein [Methanolobus profundi]SFM16937.1 sarcinarray family protein [Methanolobus profundi]